MFDEGKYGNVDLIGGNAYVFEKITHRDVRYCCFRVLNFGKTKKGVLTTLYFVSSNKNMKIIMKKRWFSK